MANVYSLTVAADTRQLRVGQRDLRRFGDSADMAAASTRRLATTASRAGSRAFRPMTGAIQQAGFQIGDFATQVAAGQSALIAFSQQGSQLAGIMGPGGAVLGAVIAIGGAIAGGLVRSMGQGEEATASLSERIGDLELSYRDLTEAQREYIRLNAAEEERQRQNTISGLQEQIAEQERLESNFLRLREMGEDDPDMAAVFNPEPLNEAQAKLVELRAELDTVRQESEQAAEQLDNVLNGTGDEDVGASGTTRLRRIERQLMSEQELRREQLNSQLQAVSELQLEQEEIERRGFENIEALRESYRSRLQQQYRSELADEQRIADEAAAERVAKAEAAAQAETQAFQESFNALRNELNPARADMQAFGEDVALIQEAFERGLIDANEADAMVNSLNEIGDAAANSKQGFDIMSAGAERALGIVEGQLGQAASIARETGEEGFEAYKALASAQAAIAAALTVSTILGDPTMPAALRIPLAISAGALAAGQIAVIQAQEYQGARKDGGSMSAGRDYLVGENGPEIVRMGASGYAVPNHATEKMNGNGNPISVIIQVSPGIEGTVEAGIRQQAPAMVEAAKQGVLQAIGQGGAMTRAVGRR